MPDVGPMRHAHGFPAPPDNEAPVVHVVQVLRVAHGKEGAVVVAGCEAVLAAAAAAVAALAAVAAAAADAGAAGAVRHSHLH